MPLSLRSLVTIITLKVSLLEAKQLTTYCSVNGSWKSKYTMCHLLPDFITQGSEFTKVYLILVDFCQMYGPDFIQTQNILFNLVNLLCTVCHCSVNIKWSICIVPCFLVLILLAFPGNWEDRHTHHTDRNSQLHVQHFQWIWKLSVTPLIGHCLIMMLERPVN